MILLCFFYIHIRLKILGLLTNFLYDLNDGIEVAYFLLGHPVPWN